MSEFSRETLLNIIETDHVQCGDASALARMALAAMDSEPVAEVYQPQNSGICAPLGPSIRMLCPLEPGEKLYRHAQQPVVPRVTCWSCRNQVEISAIGDCDGYCPECDAPIDLDEEPYTSEQPAPIVEREPIAWLNDAYLARGVVDGEAGSEDAGPGYIPVYRHAQPALVIPDEMTAEQAYEIGYYYGDPVDVFARGANWMRQHIIDSTLAAAPQSPGSEPATVPGKWIPVSERMPIEFEAVIAFDGDQVYGEAMYSSDDGFTIDGYEPCDRLNLQNVTHWMPLPAGPQEVK
ncbi:Eaa1 [Klebsiella quasipneumoniae]|nr:DUF551 domain-containing protein [Klebsiella quasipneumoniae]SAY02543.1 Eaa1 [Klebsiella quasipneumoniae]